MDFLIDTWETKAINKSLKHRFPDRYFYEILAKAHMPPDANLYASYLLRQDRPLKVDMNRLLLIPGDVVYVSQKPITEWNIFLTQLAPTLDALLSAQAIYKLSI